MKLGRVIGIGNTATVYEWDENKILKLFHQDYPKEAIEREFRNVNALSSMDFSIPKAYEIISYKGQLGIIYDRIEGELLLDRVMKTGDVEECAVYMASLYRKILRNNISNVPSYKNFLKENILSAENMKRKEEVLRLLETLPDGNTLCHGDFHPGNIIISKGQAVVLDFMNICHGHFLYDVARTVFLVEYTPVSAEVKDKEMLLQLKKNLANLYLSQMNITRDMIDDFLSVIIAARVGECPNEYNMES